MDKYQSACFLREVRHKNTGTALRPDRFSGVFCSVERASGVRAQEGLESNQVQGSVRDERVIGLFKVATWGLNAPVRMGWRSFRRYDFIIIGFVLHQLIRCASAIRKVHPARITAAQHWPKNQGSNQLKEEPPTQNQGKIIFH